MKARLTDEWMELEGTPEEINAYMSQACPHNKEPEPTPIVVEESPLAAPEPAQKPRKRRKKKPAMANTKWSQKEVRMLKNMRKDGLTYAQIAKKLGRTTAAVNFKAHQVGR